MTEVLTIRKVTCDLCGDVEETHVRFLCFCTDLCRTFKEAMELRAASFSGACPACWTKPEPLIVCQSCRKQRGEEASA